MLYELFAANDGVLRLLNFSTFRAGAALATAFFISVLFGNQIINALRARQGKGQPIRDLSLEAQLEKQGTPTMGGFIIWLGMFTGILLWSKLSNPYVWPILFVTATFALLGFFDDYAKVTKQTDAGVSAKMRLLVEFVVAALAAAFLMGLHGAHTTLGHAEWGPMNDLARQIAALAPSTSADPDPIYQPGMSPYRSSMMCS